MPVAPRPPPPASRLAASPPRRPRGCPTEAPRDLWRPARPREKKEGTRPGDVSGEPRRVPRAPDVAAASPPPARTNGAEQISLLDCAAEAPVSIEPEVAEIGRMEAEAARIAVPEPDLRGSRRGAGG
jgi:hypothetical protein